MNVREGVDADGYIITEVSRENVPARYESPISEAALLLKTRFSNNLHSLYLYGSVATGKAIDGKSDLDLLAVLASPASDAEQAAVIGIAGELSEKWRALVREVGIEVADVEEVLGSENPTGWGCFVKHLCVCLMGDDLSTRFEKFRPGREVAWGLNGDIGERLEQVKRNLAGVGNGESVEKICASVSRRLVRVGFGLVVAEDQVWTTDLQRSCELFCERYPDQGIGMRQALEWTTASSSSKREVLGFLKGDFVAWLLAEFRRNAGPLAN